MRLSTTVVERTKKKNTDGCCLQPTNNLVLLVESSVGRGVSFVHNSNEKNTTEKGRAAKESHRAKAEMRPLEQDSLLGVSPMPLNPLFWGWFKNRHRENGSDCLLCVSFGSGV